MVLLSIDKSIKSQKSQNKPLHEESGTNPSTKSQNKPLYEESEQNP
jgi:hypothetical protein